MAAIVAGSMIGIAVGLSASRVLASVVYQASAHDPLVIVTAVFIMCAVGFCAAWLPARRALALDSVRALRDE